MALDRQGQLLGLHAGAVVGDGDQRLTAFLEDNVDAQGAGIDRVLDELLDRRRRALDDLAGGDAVDQDRGKQPDRHHQTVRHPAGRDER